MVIGGGAGRCGLTAANFFSNSLIALLLGGRQLRRRILRGAVHLLFHHQRD